MVSYAIQMLWDPASQYSTYRPFPSTCRGLIQVAWSYDPFLLRPSSFCDLLLTPSPWSYAQASSWFASPFSNPLLCIPIVWFCGCFIFQDKQLLLCSLDLFLQIFIRSFKLSISSLAFSQQEFNSFEVLSTISCKVSMFLFALRRMASKGFLEHFWPLPLALHTGITLSVVTTPGSLLLTIGFGRRRLSVTPRGWSYSIVAVDSKAMQSSNLI